MLANIGGGHSGPYSLGRSKDVLDFAGCCGEKGKTNTLPADIGLANNIKTTAPWHILGKESAFTAKTDYCERTYFLATKFSCIKPSVTFSHGHIFTHLVTNIFASLRPCAKICTARKFLRLQYYLSLVITGEQCTVADCSCRTRPKSRAGDSSSNRRIRPL